MLLLPVCKLVDSSISDKSSAAGLNDPTMKTLSVGAQAVEDCLRTEAGIRGFDVGALTSLICRVCDIVSKMTVKHVEDQLLTSRP